MDIKKLLFVTRFEELRFDALQSLMSLRKAALQHVVFLNVIERDKVALKRGKGYGKDDEIRLREKANIRFIDWAEHLFEQGMECGVYIVVGSFSGQVIKAVEKENVDLVVIGPQKKGTIEKLVSGSDVTEILERADTPTLVYKYLSRDGSRTEQPFERPLLATSWSPAGDAAVNYLKNLKNVVQAVDVVHVASEKSLKGSSAMAIQKTRKETRKKLEAVCDKLEAVGIKASPHVYIGDTTDEIEKAARECRSTMIVAGSPKKSSWRDRWMGSTSRALAEKTIYPTLLIPQRD